MDPNAQSTAVQTPSTADFEAYKKQMADELAAAKAAAAEALEAKEQAEKMARAAELALERSGAPAPIKGEYKGYGFADGYRRVRDQQGQLCDTQMLLEKAATGDETARGILDWLIKIKHNSFNPVAPAAKKQK